jgi:glycosyltransferase involved in cell wall biosynthesis
VPEVVRRVAAEVRPVALHHVTLGSFRVLPRYDRCGVPYSLGPLAGGEVTPRALLRGARLPWGPWLSEWCRPWLNAAAAATPGLRAVVGGSRLALATSADSERVLRRLGASRTAVVFPDRLPADVRPEWARDVAGRAEALRRRVRLVWSGRAVWWKAGQLAIELLRRLGAAGVEAEMRMFSFGHALEPWRRQIAAAGLGERCRVGGFVERADLLRELGAAHVFVYPTLHDSSCPALLEAYAMGLPSLTVGLGGPANVATAATGFNVCPRNLDTWIDDAAAVVRGWQAEPARWRAASAAAQARAGEFGADYLNAVVDRWLAAEASGGGDVPAAAARREVAG